MSTVIIPSLTNQMILEIFKFLVTAEIHKRVTRACDFRSGQQDGYIAHVAMQFGSSEDGVAETAYDEGKTWLHVTHRIVDEKLESWTDAVDELVDDPDINIDLMAMNKDVARAVEEFALENPTLLIDAIKKNL